MKPSDLSEFFNLLGKAKKEKEEEFNNLLKEADINLDDLTSSLVSGIKEAKEDQKKQKKNEEKLIEQLDSIIDVIENPKEVKDITEPAVTVGVPEDFDVTTLEDADDNETVEIIDVIKPEPIKTPEISDTVAQAIKFIEETNIKEEIENSDDTNLDKLKIEIKQVRDILYKVLAHGPGSGEVRVLKMDDVDEDSAKVDGKVLQYQSSSGKFVGVGMASTDNVRTGILDVAGISTFRDRAQFDGSVGVGVANPLQKLHVNEGNIIVTNSTAPQIRINSGSTDSGSTRIIFGLATGSNHFINNSTSNDACFSSPSNMLFGIGNTRKFRIKTTDVLTDVDLIPSGDNQTSLGRSNVRWSDLFAVDATFSGNVSIAGTLTYEDVTNVDSVGIITARSGVLVGSGITLSPDGDIFAVGVSTFKDDINLPDNVELKLGSAGEVRLYHTGSVTNFIVSQHYFNMQANGYNLYSQNGSESIITAFQNGAVSLFFDGTKRFETASTGAVVTGILTATSMEPDKISLGDNEHINVGLSSDLQLYHNGSNSYIDNSTGITFIRNTGTSGSQIQLLNNNSGVKIQALAGEQSIVALANSKVELYFNGSKKIETTNTGAVVTGILTATSDISIPNDTGKIKLGASQDLEINHNGTHSFIKDAGTGSLFVLSDSFKVNSADASENMIVALENSFVKLFFDGSNKLETTNTGITVTGTTVADGADINGDLDVSGTATLGSGGSGEAVLQYQGSTKLTTKTWGVQATGTIQAIGNLEAANTISETEGKDIHIKNLKSGGGVKNVLTLGHASNNSSITGHVGNISINAPQVSISTHFSVAGVSTFNGLVKLPDSSDNQTGRLMFGDGTDLQIFHTGSAGEIGNFTGNLNVKSNSFRIFNGAANQVQLRTDQNDSVILYHSGNEKIKTTNTGAVVTGILTATSNVNVGSGVTLSPDGDIFAVGVSTFVGNLEIRPSNGQLTPKIFYNDSIAEALIFQDNIQARFGGSSDLRIYHDGSHSYVSDQGTGQLKILSSTLSVKDAGDNTVALEAVPTTHVKLFYNGSNKLETTNTGVDITGTLTASDGIKLTDADNLSILLGASEDMRIRHTGSHSEITDEGTGHLRLGGGQVRIGDATFSKNAAIFDASANTRLYFNDTKRFETTNTGAVVTGILTATSMEPDKISLGDSEKIHCGIGSDLEIFHSGNHSFIKDVGTGSLFISSNQFNAYNQAANEKMIVATQNSSVELYHDNTLRFTTSDSGAEITGDLEVTNTASGTGLKLIDSSSKNFIAGGGGGGSPFAGSGTNHDFRIQVGANQNAIFEYNADEKGIFKLGPANGIGITFNGASGNANFAGITTFTGIAGFGTHITLQDDAEIRLGEKVSGGNRVGDFIIRHDPNMFSSVYNVIQSNNGNIQIENRDTAGGTRFLYLKSNGVQVRSYTGNEAFIQCTLNQDVKLYYDNVEKLATSASGAVIYGDLTVSGSVSEGSDIRLKTNIKPIEDPIDKVTQIEGVSFNWKKDNKPSLGVIADQVEKIIPELVQGDDPKTVNYNGLIGLLIEAVKDQQTQIDSLKERLSKLE